MSALYFECPVTGHRVATGIEIDHDSFDSLPQFVMQGAAPTAESQPFVGSPGVGRGWRYPQRVAVWRGGRLNRKRSIYPAHRLANHILPIGKWGGE
jgi:hypothetical protein